MTTTEKMIALLRRLKVEMNGAVTDAMREYGGGRREYGLNYGVSLPTIRAAAQEYATDHELAQLLWRQEVREMKLAALYIDDPSVVTATQMEAWAAEWRGIEIAEMCAMELFWRSPKAWALATAWAAEAEETEDTALKRLAAFYMLGRLASAGEATVSDDAIAGLLDDAAIFGPKTAERSAPYALREIYRHRPELRPRVMACLDRLPTATADEVRWQVEYL